MTDGQLAAADTNHADGGSIGQIWQKIASLLL
jgi:hypothetical protein